MMRWYTRQLTRVCVSLLLVYAWYFCFVLLSCVFACFAFQSHPIVRIVLLLLICVGNWSNKTENQEYFFAGRILQVNQKGRVYEYFIRISPNSKHGFPPDCITDHVIVTGEFASQRPVTVLWCFLWSAPWINSWINNREAGDLICHRSHYDVIVMFFTFTRIVS